MAETLAVKFVGPDTIEGLAIPYGGTFAGRDLHGEAFAPTTDFCFDWFGKSGRPLLYEHGLDDALKTDVIGRQVEYETRDEGIWAQSQLDINRRYRKAVDSLIEQGALGYSSGAMAHLATKNRTGVLTRWPWVELSLTPVPAEPSTLGVYYVKSAAMFDHAAEVDLDLGPAIKAALLALEERFADDDPTSPAGVTFAAEADRLLVGYREFTDRARGVAEVRAKSGRVLSAATRARLAEHPGVLRQLADDLDALLTDADGPADDAGKSALAFAVLRARVDGNGPDQEFRQ